MCLCVCASVSRYFFLFLLVSLWVDFSRGWGWVGGSSFSVTIDLRLSITFKRRLFNFMAETGSTMLYLKSPPASSLISLDRWIHEVNIDSASSYDGAIVKFDNKKRKEVRIDGYPIGTCA